MQLTKLWKFWQAVAAAKGPPHTLDAVAVYGVDDFGRVSAGFSR